MTENESRAVTGRENGGTIEPEKTRVLWAGGLNAETAKVLGLVGERYELDPALGEVMVLGNKVYISLEGYLTIAQRQSSYQGYELRPMTDEERKAAKVAVDEHGWIAKVYRAGWAHPSVGYGVAREDRIANAQVKQFAREIAEARAFRRALRGCYRVHVPDADYLAVDAETGEITEAVVATVEDAPAPVEEKETTPDWTRFWATVKNWGYTPDSVHAALKVASMRDWPQSLDQALAVLDPEAATNQPPLPLADPDAGRGRTFAQMWNEYVGLWDKANALGEPIDPLDRDWPRPELATRIGKARQHILGVEARIALFGPGPGR